MNTFTVALLSLLNNINHNLSEKSTNGNTEDFSDKSFDEETIPDEDFNKTKKLRSKLMSCPNVEKRGPNINLKVNSKRYSRPNYVKITNYIMIAITKMNAALHMVLRNSEKI